MTESQKRKKKKKKKETMTKHGKKFSFRSEKYNIS